MQASKKCQKCGAVSEFDSQIPLQACSRCGAIFAKVEAALVAGTPSGPDSRSPLAPSGRNSVLPTSTPSGADAPFLEALRASTNYPTFRGVVNVVYWFWMILAAAVAVGTVVGLFLRPGWFMTLIGGTLATLFFVIIGRLIKETSMMFADLSDAAIFTAQRAK